MTEAQIVTSIIGALGLVITAATLVVGFKRQGQYQTTQTKEVRL